MGVKVIKEGEKPNTIPCNVCDKEFGKEEYQGTKTGICKECLTKRTPEEIDFVFKVVNFTRHFREKHKLPFDWFDVRYLILKVWNEIRTPDFKKEITDRLKDPYLLTDEAVAEIWKYWRENGK